jgi:hypothetical protein
MQHTRIELPDWPRLMSVKLAAAYVGLSEATLKEIGPPPVELEKRRVLYDIKALDAWADRLSGQPLDVSQTALETTNIESRILERIGAKR